MSIQSERTSREYKPLPTEEGRADSLKVLFIVGYPRSGSTILGNLLGELEGFFHAGEIHYLWERNLLMGRRPCGCRLPIEQCEVWGEVLRGRVAPLPKPDDVVRWQSDSVRGRHWRQLSRLVKGEPSGRTSLDSYRSVLTDLYRALADVTGARVLVDSSKWPMDAAVVASLDGIEPYFLHLVRDPRGVAYSRQRRIMRRDRGGTARMHRMHLVRDGIGWLATNIAAEAVCRRAGTPRAYRVLYEDFVAAPRRVLERVASMLGEDPPEFPITGDRTAQVGVHHTAGGNRVRFDTGEIDIRQDTRWLVDGNRRDRVLTSALTLPLLRRYGYPADGSAAPPLFRTGLGRGPESHQWRKR